MMSSCTMILIRLLFLLLVLHNCQGTRSPEETCQPGYYWQEGCQDCPRACETCESNTTCTLCKKGYYGQVCRNNCQCKGDGCDKVTGDCPQGCVHGRYGKECELRCQGCGTCDRNTGQCVKCLDNYFLQDGNCRPCSNGCSVCVTDRNCTQCEGSYVLRDGRCERYMQDCPLCNASDYIFSEPTLFIDRREQRQDLCRNQASDIVRCLPFRYMSNGTCHECPDNCSGCDSDTNCTLCQKGFYGPVCENRCGEGCTGTCHKLFGHCTHDCPDGEYPAEGNGCRLCPLNCSLCESQSKCVLCEAGHFGEDCQERCTEHCTTCNKTTGQCLQCKDSYFRLNGQCKSCPQGCKTCDSINTCTQCKDSYFKHDRLCKNCPYGCDFCNTTDNCQSCKKEFHGPVDGRCLYKCPSSGITTYNVPYEDGRCGIWQDTDTNMCHLQSESYSCTSSGNCIQAIGCPYSVRCMDGQYEQASCATVMQYECKHKCKQLLSVYGCEATCTVHVKDNTRYNLLCMTDTNFIDLHTFENTTKTDCSQEQGSAKDGIGKSSTNHAPAIILVIVSVCVVAGSNAVFLWCIKKNKKKNKASKKESSNEIDLSEPIRKSFLTFPINANERHGLDEGYMGSNSSEEDNPNQTTHLPDGGAPLLLFSST